ncbi:sodium:proton antiporter [Georgenia yuyongxinii]|uniref:Sodium:proton antiporter n=1 Tax=Georgenia yuyongxinii TaxID=2589797 RepID=A0A5B8C7N5_9MICO|nr:sodium:proton antiporter [Georgenia yuyongxinii]QDC23936.1 sodium:proton antiporter [Georgenia yuyongxinii]
MELGTQLPLWSIIPFVGMLLSIAIIPLVNGHWWEKHMWKVSAFWALAFFVPFLVGFGVQLAVGHGLEVILLDYVPFIILILGLFTVSGGIVIRGSLSGTPKVNVVLLLIGTLLASWIGTTGAAMVMIRPLLRANAWRKHRVHQVVFFIFLVANIGGSLTPIGDPPLFLGFLRGVPFFWTMKLLPMMLLNVAVLIVVFYLLDSYFMRKEGPHPESTGEKVRVEGLHNIVFLLAIVGAVILSGVLPGTAAFTDPATGDPRGLTLMDSAVAHVAIPYVNLLRDAIILAAAFLAYRTTNARLRTANGFGWGPIQEVAILFAGIFVTMIPALAILQARGSELGLTSPAEFFWATGGLSSFLDNAPTYLVFMTTAASLGATAGVETTLGIIDEQLLMAVSAGAVFMGANTYIGNAPNFMVRSIAVESEVRMPSFLGYMKWSISILIPLFVVDTLIFF